MSHEAHRLPLFDSPQHCGVEVSDLTRPDDAAAPSRQEIIERVYEKADADFIAGYRDFLIWFAGTVEDFIAGEVSERYERSFRKLTVREGKQLGGLFQALQREGVIEKTGGYRARNQGNPSAVYRLKK